MGIHMPSPAKSEPCEKIVRIDKMISVLKFMVSGLNEVAKVLKMGKPQGTSEGIIISFQLFGSVIFLIGISI
jgi:hypothetical protein